MTLTCAINGLILYRPDSSDAGQSGGNIDPVVPCFTGKLRVAGRAGRMQTRIVYLQQCHRIATDPNHAQSYSMRGQPTPTVCSARAGRMREWGVRAAAIDTRRDRWHGQRRALPNRPPPPKRPEPGILCPSLLLQVSPDFILRKKLLASVGNTF